MWRRNLLFVILATTGLLALVGALFPALDVGFDELRRTSTSTPPEVPDVVPRLNQAVRTRWREADVTPVEQASHLAVARRLSLALVGTIPSLEEIRRFEAHPAADRLAWWCDTLMADQRSADYLAERLARAYVGVIPGPFVLYRRHRFVDWLAGELRARRPYDELVREMIATEGLWTDRPATNFITVAIKPDTDEPPNPTVLAGRVSRAFLGVRLDCAECHDHPFASWKQEDFQGLAAYFGQTERSLVGIREGDGEFRAILHTTGEEREVAPQVPFAAELCPNGGTRREQLARWITAEQNGAFARATVNRLWAMMFGKPLLEPIDDLPLTGPWPAPLELLADDFVAHGYDWGRLVRAIAASEAFSLESRAAIGDGPSDEQLAAWAAFPLVRLRPEQVVGATIQASSLATCDYEAHILFRTARAIGHNEFIKRYGDAGEDEFRLVGETIPQRLLLLNGELLHKSTAPDLFTASARLATQARDDATAIEVCYLVCLTRRPTADEARHFSVRLHGTRDERRKELLADLCWTLLNSTEAGWNH